MSVVNSSEKQDQSLDPDNFEAESPHDSGRMLQQFGCGNSMIYSFGGSGDFRARYDIPPPNQDYEQMIFYQSGEYIAPPASGCIRSYQLQWAENLNMPIPTYYRLDPQTGAFSFTNRANQIIHDRLRIAIYSSTNAITQFTDLAPQLSQVIDVKTECGPESTVVTASVCPSQTWFGGFSANQASGNYEQTDSYTSSNPTCPMVDYALTSNTASQNQFDFLDFLPSQNQFTVSLKQYLRSIDGTYNYQVRGVAEGGAQAEMNCFTIVGQAQPQPVIPAPVPIVPVVPVTPVGCGNSEIYRFDNSGDFRARYDIPPPNQDYEQMIFYQSGEYIAPPASGCIRSYQLQWAENLNMPVPSYYRLDQQTGAFSFTNRANQIIHDRLQIVIYSSTNAITQFNNIVPQLSQVIDVKTECGPESTVVTASVCPSQNWFGGFSANQASGNYEQTGSYTSSNPTCPMVDYALTSNTASLNQFDFQDFLPSQNQFTVSLKQQLRSIDGTYNYQVRGVAEGGALAEMNCFTIVGQAQPQPVIPTPVPVVPVVPVTPVGCGNAEIYSFGSSGNFRARYDIPPPNQDYEQMIFYQSGEYIGPSASGCIRSYQLQWAENLNMPVPSYYRLDLQTGAFSFTNRANQIIHDRLQIAIYSSTNAITQFNNIVPQLSQVIEVKTECGPESTVVTPSVCPSQTWFGGFSANLASGNYEQTDSYTSSNPTCPMVDYALTSNTASQNQFDFMDFLPSQNQFTVGLRQNLRNIGGTYNYQVRGVAEGGAQAIMNCFTVVDSPQPVVPVVPVVPVTPVVPQCQSATLKALQANYFFIIPASGYTRTDVIFNSAQNFVSTPAIGGGSTSYRLEMVNGRPLPSYYDFNQLTGEFKVTLNGDSDLIGDVLRIVVMTTGGCTEVQTSQFTVITECGLDSTTVITPTLQTIQQTSGVLVNTNQLSAQCQSSNPRCPITNAQLIQGQNNFDIIVNNQGVTFGQQYAAFTVSLKSQFVTAVNSYSYTVQCQAQGGAIGQATGMMVVNPAPIPEPQPVVPVVPSVDCSSTFLSVPMREYRYNIPSQGTSRTQVLFESRMNYVSNPPQGCQPSYQLKMTNGNSVPSYYTMNRNTGALSFSNSGDRVINDRLEIVISFTQCDCQQRVTEPFSVITECGPLSTQVTRPTLQTQEQSVDDAQNSLTISGSFQSSNELCPIENCQLDQGSAQFDFSRTFQGFTVSLKNQFLTIDGNYQYVVQCAAKGGASNQALGLMLVNEAEINCANTFVGAALNEYKFDIPREGIETTQVIFSSSQSFISQSPQGCQQSYQLRMRDGSSVPSYYQFNSFSGSLSFMNSGDRFINDRLEIVIDFTQCVCEQQATQQFTVITECGSSSTLITQPTLPTQTQSQSAGSSLLISDRFESSNSLCPIEDCSLQFGEDQFNFVENMSGFTVTLKSAQLSIEGCYTYIVQCTARGGAYSYQLSSMCITPDELDCSAGQMIPSQTNFQFDVAKPSSIYNIETLLSQSQYQNFYDSLCTQCFEIHMTNGEDVPVYYQLIDSNGELFFTNPSYEIDDELELTVYSVSGNDCSNLNYDKKEQYTIRVQSFCGLESADCILPNLPDLYQSASLVENVMELDQNFQSSNPSCPVTSISLTEGLTDFDFEVTQVNTQTATFSINLKNYLLGQTDNYSYSLRATIEGGKQCYANGLMVVTEAEIYCSLSELLPTDPQELCLPMEDQSIEQVLFNDGSQYITQATLGCSRHYHLEMSNGLPVPDYYVIDSDTGRISMTIQGNQQVDDRITVVIDSSHSTTGPVTQRTSDIQISTKCCAQSTLITRGTNQETHTLIQAANAEVNNLVLESNFASSNALCPINDITICDGSEHFDFESSVSHSVFWDFDEYAVRLKDSLLTTTGSYNYQVCATAEGGAALSQFGSMTVTRYRFDCTIGSLTPRQSNFIFDVAPMNSEVSTTTLISSDDYVNTYASGCKQCFEIQNKPSYYSFDDITGELQFTNPSNPIDDALTIIVYSVDSGFCSNLNFDHRQEHTISVKSQCGISSSDCIAPNTVEISQPANAEVNSLEVISQFQSTNPACPISTVSLTIGGNYFNYEQTSLDTNGAQFKLDLKDQFLASPSTYSYTVRAIFEGGRTCDATGQMQVNPPVYDCSISNIVLTAAGSFQELCLPQDGQAFQHVLFNDGSEYITDAQPTCDRTFALEMTNGAPVPAYYNIDPTTGRITATIPGDNFVSDLLRVVIQTGDHLLRTGNIYVSTQCCAESTLITDPVCVVLEEPANSLTNGLERTSDFDSSNALCPITDVTLCDGQEHFTLEADVYDGTVLHLYDVDYSDFKVSLQSQFVTTEGTYSYSVCAKALGGKEATVSCSMKVTPPEYVCIMPNPRSLRESYEFVIPRSGEQITRTIVQRSSEYIAPPIFGCEYTYSVEMCSGDPTPVNRYAVDQATGQISINIDGDAELRTDNVRVAIHRMSPLGDIAETRKTECFNVQTICGSASTALEPPSECQSLSQIANAATNQLSYTSTFSSTNARCPMERFEISQGSQYFDIVHQLNTANAEISLKNEYLQQVNTYSFTVVAYARGGAYATQQCTMEVTQPIYDCSLANKITLPENLRNHRYFLPKPESMKNEIIFQSSTEYFSAASTGCTQHFSIELSDDSTNDCDQTVFYDFEENGKLVFRNVAFQKVVDHVTIVITTTGGQQEVVQRSETFTVTSECGPESTDLTIPALPSVSVDVNNPASITGNFISSNDECPILSNQFCTGSNSGSQFSLTERDDKSFDISLKAPFNTQVNSYQYEVCATAVGGATGTNTGTMTINSICAGAQVVAIADRTFYIPETGSVTEVLMSGQAGYITNLNPQCTYTMTFVMEDGSNVPDYFTINQADGSMKFQNVHSNLVDKRLAIRIIASDPYGNLEQFQTENFRVQSICGLQSTQVIAPTASEITQQLDTNTGSVLSATGSFSVTNPNCPLQIIALQSESTPFFYLSTANANQFVARRHLDQCLEGQSPESFTVYAMASGSRSVQFTYNEFECVEPITLRPVNNDVNPISSPSQEDQVTPSPSPSPGNDVNPTPVQANTNEDPVCLGVLSNPQSFTFALPQPGLVTEEVLMTSSEDFIQPPAQGCTMKFTLEVITDESSLNAEDFYVIDTTSGRLTFSNSANRLANDRLQILIETVGGAEPITQRTETFTVQTFGTIEQEKAAEAPVGVGFMPVAPSVAMAESPSDSGIVHSAQQESGDLSMAVIILIALVAVCALCVVVYCCCLSRKVDESHVFDDEAKPQVQPEKINTVVPVEKSQDFDCISPSNNIMPDAMNTLPKDNENDIDVACEAPVHKLKVPSQSAQERKLAILLKHKNMSATEFARLSSDSKIVHKAKLCKTIESLGAFNKQEADELARKLLPKGKLAQQKLMQSIAQMMRNYELAMQASQQNENSFSELLKSNSIDETIQIQDMSPRAKRETNQDQVVEMGRYD